MEKKADYWINKLNLKPHPEGGYYKETYRSKEQINPATKPDKFKCNHSYSTAIYFLIESGQVSKLHRLQSDEIWHHYCGSPLKIFVIGSDGSLEVILLGKNPDDGQVPQAVIHSGKWFGGMPIEDNSFTLIGCTVAPSFEFEEFELGKKEEMIKQYPQHKNIIEILT